MVGKFRARVSASLSSESTGNGRCSREAISVWYALLWVERPNTCAAPAAFSSANRSRNAQVWGVQPRAPGIMSQSSTNAILPGSPVLGYANTTVRPGKVDNVTDVSSVATRVIGGIFMPSRCPAAPSSVGAGILLQSTSSRFLWFIAPSARSILPPRPQQPALLPAPVPLLLGFAFVVQLLAFRDRQQELGATAFIEIKL